MSKINLKGFVSTTTGLAVRIYEMNPTVTVVTLLVIIGIFIGAILF